MKKLEKEFYAANVVLDGYLASGGSAEYGMSLGEVAQGMSVRSGQTCAEQITRTALNLALKSGTVTFLRIPVRETGGLLKRWLPTRQFMAAKLRQARAR